MPTIHQPEQLPLFDGKICKQCGEWKPFKKYMKGGYAGGYSPRCRHCTVPLERAREYDRQRYAKNPEPKKKRAVKYRQDHIEEIREKQRQWRITHKDEACARNKAYYEANKEEFLRRCKLYREENVEQRRAYEREYRKHNKESIRAAQRKWIAEHPEEIRQYFRDYHRRRPEVKQMSELRRRTREKASGSFTTAEWRALCEKYGNQCLCCGRKKGEIILSADHVVPLSKGGANTISNIQPLCVECNVKKHTKTTDYRPKE